MQSMWHCAYHFQVDSIRSYWKENVIACESCKSGRSIFGLMPKGEHIRRMIQYCGCACSVFNRVLTYQKEMYESDMTYRCSYNKLANLIPAM